MAKEKRPTHRDELESLERSYRRVFQSEDGLVVLKDLEECCFIHSSTYVKGCTDATLINEGCRMVFIRIVERMRMDLTKAMLAREAPKLPTELE